MNPGADYVGSSKSASNDKFHCLFYVTENPVFFTEPPGCSFGWCDEPHQGRHGQLNRSGYLNLNF
jgi:hypothetical protein